MKLLLKYNLQSAKGRKVFSKRKRTFYCDQEFVCRENGYFCWIVSQHMSAVGHHLLQSREAIWRGFRGHENTFTSTNVRKCLPLVTCHHHTHCNTHTHTHTHGVARGRLPSLLREFTVKGSFGVEAAGSDVEPSLGEMKPWLSWEPWHCLPPTAPQLYVISLIKWHFSAEIVALLR